MNSIAVLRYLASLSIGLLLLGCGPPRTEQPQDFVAERDLIVFVGQRLSVTRQPVEPGAMDSKFEARYRVLQLVFGKYEGNEITFTVYDHYGDPRFARYDTVLLFVSRHEGHLYHEKYQFFDVYPTKDGRWATPGDPYKYEPEVHRGTLKPVRIQFATGVTVGTESGPSTEGTYVEDLFEVKKAGVLKARGLFK
jgi:hypothetical protein